MERTLHAINSPIVMQATKELLRELLLAPQGMPVKTWTFKELVLVLVKYKYMTLPSVKNNVTTLRYLQRFGIMDSITMLKGCSNWPYVLNNIFMGQYSNSNKVFLFKMSERGLGSSIDLVKQMQPGGDHQDA